MDVSSINAPGAMAPPLGRYQERVLVVCICFTLLNSLSPTLGAPGALLGAAHSLHAVLSSCAAKSCPSLHCHALPCPALHFTALHCAALQCGTPEGLGGEKEKRKGDERGDEREKGAV